LEAAVLHRKHNPDPGACSPLVQHAGTVLFLGVLHNNSDPDSNTPHLCFCSVWFIFLEKIKMPERFLKILSTYITVGNIYVPIFVCIAIELNKKD
jgi:hypothetical protein